MIRRAMFTLFCLLALAAACAKAPAPATAPAPAPSLTPAPVPAPAPGPQDVVLSGLRFTLPPGWERAPGSLTGGMEAPPAAAFWLPGVSDEPEDGNGFPFLLFSVSEGPGAKATFARLLAEPERLAESVGMRFDDEQQYTVASVRADPDRQLVRLAYTCLDVDSGELLAGQDVLIASQDGFVEVELYSRLEEDVPARADFEAMIGGFARAFTL